MSLKTTKRAKIKKSTNDELNKDDEKIDKKNKNEKDDEVCETCAKINLFFDE